MRRLASGSWVSLSACQRQMDPRHGFWGEPHLLETACGLSWAGDLKERLSETRGRGRNRSSYVRHAGRMVTGPDGSGMAFGGSLSVFSGELRLVFRHCVRCSVARCVPGSEVHEGTSQAEAEGQIALSMSRQTLMREGYSPANWVGGMGIYLHFEPSHTCCFAACDDSIGQRDLHVAGLSVVHGARHHSHGRT